MSTIDYLIAIHCTVMGANDELLGSDESHISQINCQFFDVKQNQVIQECSYLIQNDACFADQCSNAAICINRDNNDNEKESKVSLKQAIEQMDSIIADLSSKNPDNISFLVDGMLQLRQCLHPQAVRHGIKLKSYYFQFFDLRHEYRKWSGKQYLATLEEIAKDACIEDAKHSKYLTASCCLCVEVIRKLIKNGHVLKSPEMIMKQLRPGMSTGYIKDEAIVRVRGLPWQVSDEDVADFFKGLNIVRGGVALCLNSKGRRNGEALVRFENEEQRNFAIKRHKHHLSGRYIEVYKGSAQDYLKIARGPSGAMNATSSFLSNGGEVIIRMRGLPYSALAKDVLEFFGSEAPVHKGESGIMFVYHPDGTATGDAFALFQAEEQGKTALKKHREKIGTRYVELFRSTQAELQQVLTMYNVGYNFVSPVGMVSPMMPPILSMTGRTSPAIIENNVGNERVHALVSMSCLRLRGLPFSASKDDIINFLCQHSNGIIGTVHIIYNLQGRPSGECFVQLKSVDLAHVAANDLHLKHIGERYIEVFQCSVHDMSLMLATSHANLMASQNKMHINNNTNHLSTNPMHIQQVHRLLAPSSGSNGFIHPMVTNTPNIFNGNFHQISSALSPVRFFQPHLFQLVAPMVPADTVNFPATLFGKPACFAYRSSDQQNRLNIEKNRQIGVNRCAELFLA